MSQQIYLGPLLRANGARITDRALTSGGTHMRGGFNFEVRDGEWWTRKGEECVLPRIGSSPWWWILDVNRSTTIACNPWYAIALIEVTSGVYGVSPLCSGTTESTTFTNGSASCTSTSTRVPESLMLVGSAPTTEVYRIVARTGTAITLDRNYEGSSGAKNVTYIRPLAQNLAGTNTDHDDSARVIGSAVIFEQLVTHAAGDLSASSPAVTAGHTYLVVTSNQSEPWAIDLTAYESGSPAAFLRYFFWQTHLGVAGAIKIGSDTAVDGITPRGVYSAVYKNRLFIGAASDPNDLYGSRTLWWSDIGNFLVWHTGIAGETAAPNYKTFDGEGNSIAGMNTLGDDLIIHRDDTQEVCTGTQSLATPFVFRTNNENLGVRDFSRSNRIVVANGKHYIWTRRGPYAFDGRNLTPLCEDMRGSLRWLRMLLVRHAISHVQHDAQMARIYWFANANVRNSLALPASANLTYKDTGETYQNYKTVFVYDYDADTYWFEDRPTSVGGGMASINVGQPATLMLSRIDGTLVIANGRSKSKDASMSAPQTAASDVVVTCAAETPWLDFGAPIAKVLKRIETVERSLIGEGPWDNNNDVDSGDRSLQIKIYGDMNPEDLLSYCTSAYSSTDTQLATDNVVQASTFVREFTPRCHGRQLKLVITNTLTAGSIFVGAKQSPARIVDILLEFDPLESTSPRTTLNSISLSDV